MEYALIVDDTPGMARQMAEILKSIGHTCESALDQAAALKAFEKLGVTYCVVDLEIPVVKNGLSRIENGLNLIQQLAERRSSPDVFIIAATSHAGAGGHDLAVRAMQMGAGDYIAKSQMVTGAKALDVVVAQMIAKRSAAKPRACKTMSPDPRPFISGVLDFYPNRVELEGVKVMGKRRDGNIRAIADSLLQLRQENPKGGVVGEDLATSARAKGGQNGVASTIGKYKPKLVAIMFEEHNLVLELDDVIENRKKGHGYRFSDKIECRVHKADVPVGVTVKSTGVTVDGTVPDDPEVAARRNWIRQEIAKRGGIRLPEVMAKFKCSDRTAKRDFEALSAEIMFVGSPKTGAYRLKVPVTT